MITIENTDKWVIRSQGNSACFEMTYKPTLETRFVQYGDDATAFNAEYEGIQKAYMNPASPFHIRSWDDCLYYLWCYYTA